MRRQIEQAGNDLLTAASDAGQELNMMQRLANRIQSLAIIFLAIMTFAAVSFSLIEGKDLSNGFWWATVTATTVGYGDLYPTHLWSKIIGGLFMFICTFVIVPIVTAKFSAHLIVNSDAFTHTEQERLKNESAEQVALLREIVKRLDALENKS